MVTRGSIRGAGVLALGTAALLAGSQVLFQGGPPSSNASSLVRWFTAHSTTVPAAAVLWLLAMLGLGIFAVAFREAMWATVLDHPWVTPLFVQGSAVCGTLAVVATAGTWALTTQASAGTIDPVQALTVWEVADALLRFATWGLAPPLVVAAIALWRHSALGHLAAIAGLLLAAALLAPMDRTLVLFGFSAWLGLVGAALLIPTQPGVHERVEAGTGVG